MTKMQCTTTTENKFADFLLQMLSREDVTSQESFSVLRSLRTVMRSQVEKAKVRLRKRGGREGGKERETERERERQRQQLAVKMRENRVNATLGVQANA
jgi:hypothetical protein